MQANYEQRAESEAGDSGVGVESGLDEHSNLNSQEDSGIAASTEHVGLNGGKLSPPLPPGGPLKFEKHPSFDEGVQNGTTVS